MLARAIASRSGAGGATASLFGVLAGLGGLRHGVGEIFQGNVPTGGLFIESWAEGPFALYMEGEPGLTIIPNMLATGILAVVFSVAVIAWAAPAVRWRRYGLVLSLLSLGMLLFGGGVGPPVVGLLAGAAGTTVNAPLNWWRTHLSTKARRLLAALWPWVFGIAALNGIFLFVASFLLVWYLHVDNSDLFLGSFYLAVLSALATIVTGIAYDLERRSPQAREG